MKSALHAWEVVCPDGLVRHLLYINRGDALCDAEVYSEEGCRGRSTRRNFLQWQQAPFPEGKHRVRRCSLASPSLGFETKRKCAPHWSTIGSTFSPRALLSRACARSNCTCRWHPHVWLHTFRKVELNMNHVHSRRESVA